MKQRRAKPLVRVIAHSTSADACGKVASCDAGHQEVDRCSTRGRSQGMHITFASTKANKAEPTLALKSREDVTRNLKLGYQSPQNRTCVCVDEKKNIKHFFKIKV